MLWKRIATFARLVILAANESLERARIALSDELGIRDTALGAYRTRSHHDIGLVIRRAVRVDAHRARFRPECRHLHLRHAARCANLFERFDLSLGQRERDIAVGPTRTADEHAPRLVRSANLEVLATFRALPHIRISRNCVGKRRGVKAPQALLKAGCANSSRHRLSSCSPRQCCSSRLQARRSYRGA